MKVLIVQTNPDLGDVWAQHMRRNGLQVDLVQGQSGAILALHRTQYQVLVLDLVLSDGSALAVADFASYRHPSTQIVFVTNTSFFSDGSIFRINANARAFVQSDTPAKDLTAMVTHYAKAG